MNKQTYIKNITRYELWTVFQEEQHAGRVPPCGTHSRTLSWTISRTPSGTLSMTLSGTLSRALTDLYVISIHMLKYIYIQNIQNI